jgi:hypothetical protein
MTVMMPVAVAKNLSHSAKNKKQQKRSKHVEDVDEEEPKVTEPEQIVESKEDDKVKSGEEPEGNDKVSEVQKTLQSN